MYRSISLLLIFGVIVCILPPKVSSTYRLPNNTKPLFYNIFLETRIDKEDFDFKGVITITIKVEQNSSEIVFHSDQLEILDIELLDFENNVIPVNHTSEKDTDFLKITSDTELIEDQQYDITVKYKGTLRSDFYGFYNSSYKNDDGKIIYLAATLFEAANARHAFPCYDEPGFKAQFIITIKHGKNYTAVSNMPVDGEPFQDTNETVITKFQRTPLMSTYLIAFFISDFKSISDTSNRMTQKIFSRSGTQNQSKFALEISLKLLNSLQEYFGINYPLPKLDHIAFPTRPGAMENWGLIAYSETNLFYNKSNTNTVKLNNALLIAHECSHQWIGNLVTPSWWTYLWLKEGLATLLSYKGIEMIYPNWNIEEYFMVLRYQGSLSLVNELRKHPITIYVEQPKYIKELLSYPVVYSKSASVLRMIENVLTEKTFQKSLRHFLLKMSYKMATEDDLIDSFIFAANEDEVLERQNIDLKEFIYSWTHQDDVPLLTVIRDYEKGTIKIIQTPLNENNEENLSEPKLWWIPFNIITKRFPDYDNTIPDHYVRKIKSIDINVTDSHNLTNTDWLILNKKQTGYYRVNYDEENWRLITEALVQDVNIIHKYNRAQLLNDVQYMAFNKNLPLKIVLNLLKYIKNEKEYAPWMSAIDIFSKLRTFLNGDENYGLLKLHLHDLIKPFFDEIGIDEKSNNPELRKILRSDIIDLACSLGVQTCLNYANEKLNSILENQIEIDPNSKLIIYCAGLRNGTEKQFLHIFNNLLNSNIERDQLISSLACINNESLLKFYLKSSINTSKEINFDLYERRYILENVFQNNEIGMTATLDFLLEDYENYANLSKNFKYNILFLVISRLSKAIVNDQQKDKLIKLLQKTKSLLNLNEDEMTKKLNKIDNHLIYIQKYQQDLLIWLKEQNMDIQNNFV